MEENKFLKQAKEELAYLSGDPDFQRLVESRAGMLMDIDCYKEQCRQEALIEGRAEGHAKGHAEGRAEGKNEKAKEIAKKLLELKIPIAQIITATGLSKKEIEKL